jgi:hypothetical protein
MTRLRIQWICGFIAAFMTIAASAEPPTYKINNRTYENWVTGGSCSQFDNGQFCRVINVWENYNVKGTYEYTEASFETWREEYYDPSDGSWEYGWRMLTCLIDKESIATDRDHVTIKVVLDTEDLGCYQWGYLYGWDPDIGDYYEPYAFSPGVRIIEGEWKDPFSYGSSMWNGNYKNYYYDGWSGEDWKDHGANHCQRHFGDMMTSGGFTTIGVTGRVRSYEFDGPYGPTWSSYSVSSCNENFMQR